MHGCESWTIKKAECQRIDAFKLWCWRTLESSLDSKEIKPVSPKGNQPWIFTGRTDAKIEFLILWPPDAKILLIGKDPHVGKEWRQKEKETAEDEMLDSITNLIDMDLSKLQKTVEDRGAWHTTVHGVIKRVGHNWATKQQQYFEDEFNIIQLSFFNSPN